MKVTPRSLISVCAALTGIVVVNVATFGGRGQTARAGTPVPAVLSVVAGPGRVEPASEEVQVSAQLGGTLRRVAVEEGDRVLAGQVLAVLENDDYRARVASAEAEWRRKEAGARKVVNGARDQERAEAAASLKILETLLELDDGRELPIGLRVQAFIEK